jgi:hypothetical protein
LSYGAVSPASGYQNGKYVYSINYRHPQGLPPAAINVVIDGTASDNMTWTTGQSGNYTTDQVFIYEVSGSSLTVGSHTYTFSATDNASHTAFGDIESHSGPTISAQASGGFGGSGGGSGGAAPVGPGITNLSILTNSDGLFNLPGEARSEDGKVLIKFAKGVLAQTKDKTQLKSVKIVPVNNPAAAPSGSFLMGLAYEFTPEGAIFTPAVPMTIYFDPEALPENADLNSLKVAVYNSENKAWEILTGNMNKAENSVTAEIEHFSLYTLTGKKAAPPQTTQPALAPAKFSLSGISVNPVTVLQGEAVTVSTRVSNTGEIEGEYEVLLKINNIVESSRTVMVKAGGSETVTFTVSRERPGDYEVEINGNKAVYTVHEAPPATTTPAEPDKKPGISSPSWLLIILLVVGGLAIGIGGVMLYNRGRK